MRDRLAHTVWEMSQFDHHREYFDDYIARLTTLCQEVTGACLKLDKKEDTVASLEYTVRNNDRGGRDIADGNIDAIETYDHHLSDQRYTTSTVEPSSSLPRFESSQTTDIIGHAPVGEDEKEDEVDEVDMSIGMERF